VQARNALTRSGSGPSDAALVLAARAGEDWAKEALFRRYAPMVNGLAFRTMGRDDDVDDLVQDSFANALTNLHRLEEPQAFAGWISAIVVRTASKIFRRRKLLRRLGLRSKDEAPDVEMILGHATPPDLAAEVHALLERLSVEHRMVLVLRRAEGMQLDEIANAMGISLATVKRRLDAVEEELARLTTHEPVRAQ